jgi:hypothetical protein
VEIVHTPKRNAVLDLNRPLVVQVSVMCLGGLFLAILIKLTLVLRIGQVAGRFLRVHKHLADLCHYLGLFHAAHFAPFIALSL